MTRPTLRIELGCPGHLIVARSFRWRRHTQIGNKYRVSSVGDYFPGTPNATRDTVGSGDDDFFETMVFPLTAKQEKGNEGCGCNAVKDWSELDGKRYATAGAAQVGHEAFVKKYLALAKRKRGAK
jgi:hypothetical protein